MRSLSSQTRVRDVYLTDSADKARIRLSILHSVIQIEEGPEAEKTEGEGDVGLMR